MFTAALPRTLLPFLLLLLPVDKSRPPTPPPSALDRICLANTGESAKGFGDVSPTDGTRISGDFDHTIRALRPSSENEVPTNTCSIRGR